MAKAKTGSFYLTETITLDAAAASGTRVQGEIDLGAYINVPTGQAIAVTEVDYVWQRGSDFDQSPDGFLAGNGALSAQLTSLNPGTLFVRADDQSLISSAALAIDQTNNIGSHVTDLYPDNFGPANLSEAYLVVNDSIYLVAGNDNAAIGGSAMFCTVRVKAQVVKLSQADWMAIAIQSTASDN
jgi:hypothetical protein